MMTSHTGRCHSHLCVTTLRFLTSKPANSSETVLLAVVFVYSYEVRTISENNIVSGYK